MGQPWWGWSTCAEDFEKTFQDFPVALYHCYKQRIFIGYEKVLKKAKVQINIFYNWFYISYFMSVGVASPN